MKILKLTVLFLAIVSILPFSANAQEINICGTDQARKKLIEEHPEILQQEIDFENYTRDFAANYNPQSGSRASGPYIIPVVFHILCQTSETNAAKIENISNAQIYDQMRILNNDYNKRNADTATVIVPFKKNIANVGFEFRLANRDPNGNVTNGIDRVYTVQSLVGNDYSKVNNWPREKYLNIWVTKAIGADGAAGYSYYPSSVDQLFNTPNRDGVILLHDYIGSIGTGRVEWSRALTHEVGHWLNLKHVWGDSNEPTVACGDDDVNDTPQTKGWKSCPKSLVLTWRDSTGTHSILASQLDSLYTLYPDFVNDSVHRNAKSCDAHKASNFENYMEYSYCSKMFTEGQKIRMTAALEGTKSNRNNLWNPANLIATGTDDTIYDKSAAVADFGVVSRFVCTQDNAEFRTITDASEIDTYAWTFSNAIPSTSDQRNPIVKFQTAGYQTVTLTVTNAQGSTTKTRNNLVFVSYANPQILAPFTQGFEDPNVFSSGWGSANYDNNNTSFSRVDYGTRSGNGVAKLNNYQAQNDRDVDEIVTPGIDLTSLSSAQMFLTFQYSWASTAANFSVQNHLLDSMNIYASTDCGKTWGAATSKGTKAIYSSGAFNPSALLNAGSVPGNYQPIAGSPWKLVSISLPPTLKKSHVMFRFQALSSVGGNNLFIDDINIGLLATDIEDFSSVSNLSIYPNPTHDDATLNLELSKAGNLNVKVYDLTGKEVLAVYKGWVNAGETQMAIEGASKLSAGVYIVSVNAGESVTQRKLIVQ